MRTAGITPAASAYPSPEKLPCLALRGVDVATWMMALIDGDDGPDLDGLVVEQALPAPAAKDAVVVVL